MDDLTSNGRIRLRASRTNEIAFTPEMLRELQLIQLECLIELDRICRKHGIRYSMDGGTLLGAVRHKGFIPWDDDIDVIMMRDEYERFFDICKNDLDVDRFFLQEHRTDEHYRVGYPRIRRKDTVYVRAGQERFSQTTGVLIDIFVLDNVPDAMPLRYPHRALRFCFRKILWSATGRIVSESPLLRLWYAIVSTIPARVAFRGFDSLAVMCNRRKTELVCHYAMTYPNPRTNGFGTPAYLMNDFTELEFEGHAFKAVAEYDKYLTLLYGDYMTPPPEEKRRPHIHLSAFEGVKQA
jgi:lipopolysaccharide cholinephosphotransferase